MDNKKRKFSVVALATIMSFVMVGCQRGTAAGGNQGNGPFAPGVSDNGNSGNVGSDTKGSTEEAVSSSLSNETIAPTFLGMKILNGLSLKAKKTAQDKFTIADFVELPQATKDEDGSAEFFVNPSETMKVLVCFSNPDKVSFSSLTVNGTKFESQALVKDDEGVILEIKAPETSGVFELSLDSAVYLKKDNSLGVLDVTDAKKTKVAASYHSAPSATVVNKEVGATSASYTFKFSNLDALTTKDKVLVYLSDGLKQIGEAKEIDLQNPSVEFDNLQMESTYQVGVAVPYDLLDGKGNRYGWAFADSFDTQSIFSFENVTATKNAISFGVKSIDEKVSISKVSLFDGETEKSSILGSALTENNSFGELLSNHDYSLVLNYVYLDSARFIKYDIKTLAMSVPLVFGSAKASCENLDYNLSISDADDILQMDSIVFFSGDTQIRELDKTKTSDSITDLVPDTDYTIKVSYSYDLNDGTGKKSAVSTIAVKTKAYVAPTVSLSVTSDKTSVGYQIEVTENNADLTTFGMDSVALLDADGNALGYVVDAQLEGSFDNLYSDEAYSIKLEYHYNLKDKKGNAEDGLYHEEKTIQIKTKTMDKPSVSIVEPSVDNDTIKGKIAVNEDFKNQVSEVKVELYTKDEETQEDKLVASTIGREYEFTDLASLTNYRIQVTYQYSMNTKNETTPFTGSVATSVKTTPSFEITEFTLSNSEEIRDGDEIYAYVKFTSNVDYDKLKIVCAYINGIEIPTDNFEETGNTNGSIRMKVNTDNIGKLIEKEGGKVDITFDKIKVQDTSDNETYMISMMNGNNVVKDVMIFGNCYIKNADFVDKDNKVIDYFTNTDEAYVLLDLYNPTGYKVDSLTVDGKVVTDVEMLENGTKARFKVDNGDESGFVTKKITNIKYSSDILDSKGNPYHDELDQTKTASAMYLVNPETVHVKTENDFRNITGSNIYILDNNLDLEKYYDHKEYSERQFDGVFDGNGYAIENYGYRGTARNKNINYAMFNKGNMVVTNLKLSNAYFSITMKNLADNASYNGVLGGIIGDSDGSIISNCMVDKYSSFRLDNQTGKGDGYIWTGTYLGGLAGRLGESSYIRNSYNEATIKGDGYVGGLAGDFEGKMQDCYNVGKIDANMKASIGALIGYNGKMIYDDNIRDFVISDCVNLGPDRSYYTNRIALIYSARNYSNLFENCYNLSKLYMHGTDAKTGVKEVKSYQLDETFFNETLGWSENVWDFSKVDYKTKSYPTLKAFNK